MNLQIKRIYEEPADDDGYRVLVDKLWPRGVSKEDAYLDEWNKDVTPSTDLRKWFDHDPEKFEEFSQRYKGELTEKEDELRQLIKRACSERLTLLYAAKDTEHNHALVLKEFIETNF